MKSQGSPAVKHQPRYKAPTDTKRDGVHYTPPALADFLAAEALGYCGSIPRHVLDPACGEGNLLLAVARHLGDQAVQFVGYEQDEESCQRTRSHSTQLQDLQVVQADFLDSLASEPTLLDLGAEGPGRYDLVIANPPYVRTQVLGTRAKQLGERFGLRGRVDLFHAFLGAMVESLSDEGVLAVICPNRLLSTKAGATARALLADSLELCSVVDFGDTALFSAAVLPIVLIGRRSVKVADQTAAFVSVYLQRDKSAQSSESEVESVPEAVASGLEGSVNIAGTPYVISRGQLKVNSTDPSTWTPLSVADTAWMQMLSTSVAASFGEVATTRVGIKTTADSVFIRDDWHDLPEEIRPESALLRPLLTHHEANRWSALTPTRQVLYPHEFRDGRTRAVNIEDYPRALAYLETHRDRLEARDYVLKAKRNWFEVWVPQHAQVWSEPKLVWPDISDRARFFLDCTGAIVNGDCYFISLSSVRTTSDPMTLLLLMLAVANSQVAARFYDAACGNRLYGDRRRFMTQYVEQFPLPDIASDAAAHIAKLAKELVEEGTSSDSERRLDEAVSACFGVEEVLG